MTSVDDRYVENPDGMDWPDPRPDDGLGELIIEELETMDAVLVGSMMFGALSSLYSSVLKLLTKR